MSIHKIALVGCRQGPWVSVADLPNHELRIQPAGTPVSVERRGDFLRVSVDGEGPYDHVLCEVTG